MQMGSCSFSGLAPILVTVRRTRVHFRCGLASMKAFRDLVSRASLAAALAWSATSGVAAQQSPSPSPGQGIPVQTAVVKSASVPVLLRNIGSVQAFQSVLVRARVDGTLMQVVFRRGPGRQGRRQAGADRPAPICGRACPGESQAGRRRRAARQRPAGLGPLQQSRHARFRLASAGRHPAGSCGPAVGEHPSR